jgi:hypothetical protein
MPSGSGMLQYDGRLSLAAFLLFAKGETLSWGMNSASLKRT